MHCPRRLPRRCATPSSRWCSCSCSCGATSGPCCTPGPTRGGGPVRARGHDRHDALHGEHRVLHAVPPGFHFLAAEISRLSGLEPLAVFPTLAPALLLLPALGCYALANRLWGWRYGAAAALFSGLILGGTYLHFAEARYPNFIGTQFLMVLAIAALVGTYASPLRPRRPAARPGRLLDSALPPDSQLLAAVVLAFVGLLFVPYLYLRDRPKGVALLSLALLALFSVLYAWDTYDLGRLVTGLFGEEDTGRGGEAVAMAIGTKPAYDLGHLLATTSAPVAWLGLLGTLLVAGEIVRRRLEAPQLSPTSPCSCGPCCSSWGAAHP